MDSAVHKEDAISREGYFNIRKSVSIFHHCNKLKENYYLSKCKKCIDKIQYSFVIKNLIKLGNRRELP